MISLYVLLVLTYKKCSLHLSLKLTRSIIKSSLQRITFRFTTWDVTKVIAMFGTKKLRRSNKIGSCVLHFLKTQKEKGIQKVFVYSDNCGGQNRNRFIFSMFSHVSMLLNVRIIHHFISLWK
jgi:hypothetical protein